MFILYIKNNFVHNLNLYFILFILIFIRIFLLVHIIMLLMTSKHLVTCLEDTR